MRWRTWAMATAVVLCPQLANAQKTAVALRVGTLGPSLGITQAIQPGKLNVRLDVPFLTYSRNGTATTNDHLGIAYNGKVSFVAASGIVDWHPFRGALRLSGGLLYNKRKLDFSGHAVTTYQVGGTTFTPEQIGDLGGTIRLGSTLAEYVGMGFGNSVKGNSPVHLLFDLGVLHQGKPQVDLHASGMLQPTAEEAPLIQDNLSWFRWYPNLSLGVSYRVR